jgi:tetratricopeptide (TPR) repeat protein
MRHSTIERVAPAVAFLFVVVLAWFAYRPGLSGGFLFDDFANLPLLGATGPIDNGPAFWRYVTSGSADPTGRPLALLSFLIDANDWPADPHPFKQTSILLHLLNGALLIWLLARLGRSFGGAAWRSDLAAVVGASLWLLHPLFVSTTLYIVQREAMLPATFILSGLIGYVFAREAASRGARSGAWLAGVSIVGATLLGVLSKANGALLPLLAWILELIILAPRMPLTGPRARAFALVRNATLVLPSLALVAYLAKIGWAGFAHGVGSERPWTLGQRLLTEGRIVCDYLFLLWSPRPFTAGLFNDAVSTSTGWLSPPTTLLAVLFLGALAAAAIAKRRAHPALSAAILFYFAGHLLESTVVPLELYFEHRNYVPAMLMFWPLGRWLCESRAESLQGGAATAPALTIAPVFRAAIAVALVLALAALTRMGADLWGNPQEQALIWALKNPESPRAQAYAAQIEIERGRVADASRRLEDALAKHPDEIQLALNLIGAHCTMGALTEDDLAKAAHALATAPNTGRLGYDWFVRSLPVAAHGACRHLDLSSIERLLDAAAANPRTRDIPGRVQDVANLRGRLALLRGEDERALAFFDDALRADTRPGAALEQAGILARAGHPDLALRHLDHADAAMKRLRKPAFGMPSVHAWLLDREGYWEGEMRRLRSVLEEDARHVQARSP